MSILRSGRRAAVLSAFLPRSRLVREMQSLGGLLACHRRHRCRRNVQQRSSGASSPHHRHPILRSPCLRSSFLQTDPTQASEPFVTTDNRLSDYRNFTLPVGDNDLQNARREFAQCRITGYTLLFA